MIRTIPANWAAIVAATSCLLGSARAACSPPTADSRVEPSIVFVQLPLGTTIEQGFPQVGSTLRANYGDGGRIVRLDPDGTKRVLTERFHSACEFDVSFDATRILFAGKRKPHDPWGIWEMGADGTNPSLITKDLGNCRSPAYQAAFYTIDSPEPWYQVMFTSDVAGSANELGTGISTSLYSCKMDGTGVRRLTMNLSNDVDPFLMNDGRVLLASWQRMDLRRGFAGRVALFGVNTDGTDYALFSGNQGKRIKHMPCVTTQGLVVFVEADHVGWDGAGQLGSVTLRRNFHSYSPVTSDAAKLYHSPSPMRDGSVLVSARPADGSGTHGIYRLDPKTGKESAVFDDPAYHDMHAKPLVPRPRPDGRSSIVNEKFTTGKLYCLNAYVSDATAKERVPEGAIHSLRVIEGVSLKRRLGTALKRRVGTAHQIQASVPAKEATLFPPNVGRRVLGEAPVEEDGSFHVEVPADVPIQLQTLDAEGMALKTCGWIWVKHREPRGCIGCHEDPELTPENRLVLAVQRPENKLTAPVADRRVVSFKQDIMPILSCRCTSCHDGNDSELDLRPQRAYASLITGLNLQAQSNRPVVGKYLHPGQARTSPLIWRLMGRNTSRPWDVAYSPDQPVTKCPPAQAEELTDDEKRTFIEWIDLGAQLEGMSMRHDVMPGAKTSSIREDSQ